MKKYLAALGLVTVLTGCANPGLHEITERDNYWYGPDKEKMTITGGYHQTASTFKLRINDKMVIDDKVSGWSGDGEFQGEYNNLPVTASCKFVFANGMQTCIIHIDGEFASTLKFDGTGTIQ